MVIIFAIVTVICLTICMVVDRICEYKEKQIKERGEDNEYTSRR